MVQDIAQLPVANVASVAVPTTSTACVTPRHSLDIPPEEETTNQGTDVNPGPTVEEAEITKKVRCDIVTPKQMLMGGSIVMGGDR